MKRSARVLAPAFKVLLVVIAGVASMATSSNRRPVAYPVAAAGWREVITAIDPAATIDPDALSSVTDLSTGEQVPHRVWAETTPDGTRVVHVLVAAVPLHGHRYAFAYVDPGGNWQRLEQTFIAPAATVAPVTYVAPGGYRYVYYPYQPRFAVPPPNARQPYVYRAW